MRKLRLTIGLCLLAAAAAGAGPTPEDVRLGKLQVREEKLSNGLRVLMLERHSVPVVATMIWYRVGSAHELPGEKGLAHFLEHMLFKGTDRYDKGEIDLITLKNGGANNAFTAEDYTAYYFNFASDRWEQALEIEANRMRKSKFDPREVEAERKVVIEELKLYRDSPWGELLDEVQSLAFALHPYHDPIIGYQSQLEVVPRDSIYSFYRRHYNPSNATLVLVGDFDSEKTLALVKKLFGKIPKGDRTPDVPFVEPPQAGEKRILIRDSGEVPRLAAVYRGVEFGTREAVVLDVIGHILSSGKLSRLYQRLIEKDKSATAVETNNDARRDPGLFFVQVEVQSGENSRKAEAAIRDEILRLRREDVSAEELARARNIAVAEFVFDQETASGLATKIGYFDTLAELGSLPAYLDAVRSVSASEIRSVADRVFKSSNITVGQSLPSGYGARAGESSGLSVMTGQRVAERGVKTGQRVAERRLRGPVLSSVRPELVEGERRGGPLPGIDSPGRRRAGKTAGVGRTGLGAGSGKPGDAGRKLDVRRVRLPNGLVVLMQENHALPVVAVNAYVRVDRRLDPSSKEGLAEFTGRMLDEGTATRSADEIAAIVEFVGGRLSAGSDGVNVMTLSEHLDLALDLASDCLLNPVFPEDRVARERARIQSEIRSDMDDPAKRAMTRFRELVYGTHPLRAPATGYVESVGRIERADLATFHDLYYRPTNAILSIVGDIDMSVLGDKVIQAFGKWAPRPTSLPPMPAVTRQSAPVVEDVTLDKEQINVYLGHLGVRRSNPDYYSLLVMDYVLGTGPGFTDRISKTLRDQKGLAYSVYANITSSATEEPGMFYAFIGTSPENRAVAVEGLHEEIVKLREKGCTPEELANAQAYLTGSFVFNIETCQQLSELLVEIERFGLGFDYLEKFPDLVESVTADDVRRVANQYLDPANTTVVVAGPAAVAKSAPAVVPVTGEGAQ